MKKTIMLFFLIAVTALVCVIEIKTEFKEQFQPGISQDADFKGVLVFNGEQNTLP